MKLTKIKQRRKKNWKKLAIAYKETLSRDEQYLGYSKDNDVEVNNFSDFWEESP